MQVKEFHDRPTGTLTYVVYDEATKDAAVIDPVWNYDQPSSTLSPEAGQKLAKFIRENNLNLHLILETHAHADHISGAQPLKKLFPQAKIAIGRNITKVQKLFADIYNLAGFSCDGSQFDVLLEDGGKIRAGSLEFTLWNTPGHTPACTTFLIGDAAFTGDVLFMPDYGTGRCDFPGGSAEDLYTSVHERIYSLPESTRIFTGHDYMPGGRELRFTCTVKESKENNIHIKTKTTKEEYVSFRTEKDKDAAAPRLLFPSIFLNIRAGNLPDPENNGKFYLKSPLQIKE